MAMRAINMSSPTSGLTSSLDVNLWHIITEFSFGPHFPEVNQPLDNSFESTDERKYHFSFQHPT